MTIRATELTPFHDPNVDPMDQLANLEKASEQGKFVRFNMNDTEHAYYVFDPEMIRQILVTDQDKFVKGRALERLRVFLGNGLLTSEKEEHKSQRQVVQPYYNMRAIGHYADTMVELAQKHTETWQDGDIRDITNDMMEITLDVITQTMFSTSVAEDVEIVQTNMHQTFLNFFSLIRYPTDHPDIPVFYSNMQKSIIALKSVIHKIIEERRKQFNPADKPTDLLSVFMKLGWSDELLSDQVMTIFVAGHETTANTLAWTWYLLAEHPEAYQRMLDEIDTVVGNRAATYEDYEKLSYTNLIIKESMRLYPAAFTVPRKATQEVQIGDYLIPSGAQLLLSQWIVHRDPLYYDKPDQFMPERWENDLEKQNPAYAYFPFGGGPRVCLGNNFALLEACLTLVTIAQKYRLKLAVPASEVVPEPLITLRAKNLKMRVTKRA